MEKYLKSTSWKVSSSTFIFRKVHYPKVEKDFGFFVFCCDKNISGFLNFIYKIFLAFYFGFSPSNAIQEIIYWIHANLISAARFHSQYRPQSSALTSE